MKGVKHLCGWPRRAPLSARARPASGRAGGTGTAPAGAAGDGLCACPGAPLPARAREMAHLCWKASFWLSPKSRSAVAIQYNPFLHKEHWVVKSPLFFWGAGWGAQGEVSVPQGLSWVPEQGGSDRAVPELGIFGVGWWHCWAAWVTNTLLGETPENAKQRFVSFQGSF